jgi:hypothetical protein
MLGAMSFFTWHYGVKVWSVLIENGELKTGKDTDAFRHIEVCTLLAAFQMVIIVVGLLVFFTTHDITVVAK